MGPSSRQWRSAVPELQTCNKRVPAKSRRDFQRKLGSLRARRMIFLERSFGTLMLWPAAIPAKKD